MSTESLRGVMTPASLGVMTEEPRTRDYQRAKKGDPEATEPPCKCCGLEPAEPGDPDGYCTDCSIECTDD